MAQKESSEKGECYTRFPKYRKFSETSLDNFATQFLKESDPDNNITESAGSPTTDLDSVIVAVGPNRSEWESGEKQFRDVACQWDEVYTREHIELDERADDVGDENANQHNSPSSPSSDTLSLDTTGDVCVISGSILERDDNGDNQNDGQLAVVQPVEDFELEPDQFETPVGYLECHLEVMYYLGVSTYRRVEYRPFNRKIGVLQKVAFWIFCIFSLIEFACILKNETVRAVALKDLKFCVQFGYAMICLVERSLFIYLICFVSIKISIMLLHVRNMAQFQNMLHKQFSLRCVCLVISSVVLTFITALFGYDGFVDWDIKDSIQLRTLIMSRTLFVWNTNKTAFENTMKQIFDEYYYSDITLTYAFMGVTEGVFDFCATLQGEMIRDFLLLSAIVLRSAWTYFEKRVESLILIHPNNADPAEVEACLRHYKGLREATSSINEALRSVLNFHILENLFLYGHLTAQFFIMEEISMKTIFSALQSIKATLTFYISLQTYWTNGKVGHWLRLISKYEGPVDVKGILGMTIQAALDDIRDNPIGFGVDYFLINETFLMGFFAVVSSIVSMLMGFEKKE